MAGKRKEAKAAGKGTKPYHHGDLRRALLDAALELLRQSSARELTLREVARRAGVTHAAPYRHFANKEALVAAVAEEGFRRMCEEMAARIATVQNDPVRAHLELGVAYVLFAIRHPAHYQVMFSEGDVQMFQHAGLQREGAEAFGMLVKSLVDCQKAGLYQGDDPRTLAVAAWSIVHGLSMLLINNRLQWQDIDINQAEAMALQVGRFLSDGLLKR